MKIQATTHNSSRRNPSNQPARGSSAFELVDLIVVLSVVIVVMGASLFVSARMRPKSSRINCANNLKQIGLAFKLWAGDNGNRFPMFVSTTNGGSREWVNSGTVFPHFQVMSNEWGSTKLLLCPGDQARVYATISSSLTDSNISYFVGVDAREDIPDDLLSGDRNLTANKAAAKPGMFLMPSNAVVSWTPALHKTYGNILRSDGSVQQMPWLKCPGIDQRLAVP